MKPLVVGALACAIAGYWAYYSFSTHETPAGQPRLAVMDSPAPFLQTFNDSAAHYRLVALLSPT